MLATSDFNQPRTKHKVPYRSGTHLFLSFFQKNPILLSGAIFLIFINTILRLVPSIIIGDALDTLLNEGYGTQFTHIALLIVLVAVLNLVITFVGNYVFAITAFAFERDIRQEYFDVIQDHSLTFHNENNSSKLLSLGMNEIQMIRFAFNPSMRMLIQSFLSIFMIIGYFYFQLPEIELPIIIMVGFVIYFYFAYQYAKKIGPIRVNLSEEIGNLTEQSQEIFRGVEVVRSLSGTSREVDKFGDASHKYANLSRREGQLAAFYIPGLILLLLTAVTFMILVNNVVDNLITIGEMISLIGLLFSLQFINFTMPMALLNIRAALVNSNRIFNKMSWEDKGYYKDINGQNNVNWKSDLTFKNVNFSYGENYQNALSGVNITIPSESKVALIGGPGSGKTTILKLLLDLYQPQKGNITIDGVDYRNIPSEMIRQHVSMVEQEVFLFSGTIKDNVGFTRPDASEEEINNALKAAQAYEFISQMPDGVDTVIGERGVTLSGGQRQRIAIARAILANPEILLLDDSSSALDSKTEQLIRAALDNLSANRLTITVTQRLNTLVRADLIILMDKGRVIGLGDHKKLYQENEKYRTIFALLPESERLSMDDFDGGNA